MTRHLDPPIRVAGLEIFVLNECRVTRHHLPGGTGWTGRKYPIAVFIRTKSGLDAFDPDGQPLTLEEVTCRFPELTDELTEPHCQERG